MAARSYYWDFFGPRAEGTAAHFRQHLDGFIQKNGLEGCETGIVSQGEGHSAAFCRAPAAAQSAIERALRPRRSE